MREGGACRKPGFAAILSRRQNPQYILTHLQSSLLLAAQEVLAKVDRIRIEVEI